MDEVIKYSPQLKAYRNLTHQEARERERIRIKQGRRRKLGEEEGGLDCGGRIQGKQSINAHVSPTATGGHF